MQEKEKRKRLSEGSIFWFLKRKKKFSIQEKFERKVHILRGLQNKANPQAPLGTVVKCVKNRIMQCKKRKVFILTYNRI